MWYTSVFLTLAYTMERGQRTSGAIWATTEERLLQTWQECRPVYFR